MTSTPWFWTTKRAFLLDFQMPDSLDQMPPGQFPTLRNIDPLRIVQQLSEAGVQAIYIHAKDNQGNCYYPSKLAHIHSAVIGRDLLQEFLVAGEQYHIPILFYVQLVRDRRGAQFYPAKNADGTPRIIKMGIEDPFRPNLEEIPIMCLVGPGREYIRNILKELVTRYKPNGFWLDGFGWLGMIQPCYCQWCRVKFYEDTHQELPPSNDRQSPRWKVYQQWRLKMNSTIIHQLVQDIKQIHPSATVTHNGSSVHEWDGLDMSEQDDYVSNEYHIYKGISYLSLQCKKNRSIKFNRPFEIELWRFNAVPELKLAREYQIRPLPVLLTEMSIILANGGLIQYYDQILPDGSLDQRSLHLLKDAYHFVQTRESYFQSQMQYERSVSLLWSKTTECFADPHQAEIHRRELEGFAYACLEYGIPFDILYETELTPSSLSSVQVLILPNVCCLSLAQLKTLQYFVQQGGCLLGTYRMGLNNEIGEPRNNFPCEDFLGIRYIEPFTYDYAYFSSPIEHPIFQTLPLNWPISTWNYPPLCIQPYPSAEPIGRLIYPARGTQMGYPPQEYSPFPAIITSSYGKGKIIYFSFPVGAIVHDTGHPDYFQLIQNAIQWGSAKSLPIRLDPPGYIELNVWHEKDEPITWIHMVNITGWGPVGNRNTLIRHSIPSHPFSIRISFNIRRATLFPENQLLPINQTGRNEYCIEIPSVTIYSILRLERA